MKSRYHFLAAILAVVLIQNASWAQFDTILNIPPDPDLGDNLTITSNTQVNLFDNGYIGEFVDVGANDGSSTNIELNIFGGLTGRVLEGFPGSTINISGGTVGISPEARGCTLNISGGFINDLDIRTGSTVNISGGNFSSSTTSYGGAITTVTGGDLDGLTSYGGNVSMSGGGAENVLARNGGTFNANGGRIGELDTLAPATVNLTGGEFLLDGTTPVSGPINLTNGNYLTGTLENGSVFVFQGLIGDSIQDNTLNLITVPLDPADPILNVPTDPAPDGLRDGQTLNMFTGAAIPDYFAAVNATININDGSIGRDAKFFRCNITMNGGSLGFFPKILDGTELVIHDGTTNGFLRAYDNGEITINGGTHGSVYANPAAGVFINGGDLFSIDAQAWSYVSITGGNFESDFDAKGNCTLLIDGGSFGRFCYCRGDSNVTISGGTFGDWFQAWFNSNVELRGDQFQVDGVPVSGSLSLSGGSVFTGILQDGSVMILCPLANDSIASGTTTLTTTSIPSVPPIVNVPADPAPNGIHSGQTLNLNVGGELPKNFAAIDSSLNIHDGVVGEGLETCRTSVKISGGTITDRIGIYDGTDLTICGGSIGLTTVYGGSMVEISGGVFTHDLRVASNNVVDIIGTQFLVDGTDITSLIQPNTPYLLTDRDVTLSGTLEDGSPFLFYLQSFASLESDYMLGTLYLNLPPQPQTIAGDAFTVTRGDYIGGTTTELAESDNQDLSVRRGVTDLQAKVEFEIEGVSPILDPAAMEVTLEAAVFARSTVGQTIELYDYQLSAWEEVDDRNASRLVDATVTIALAGELSRFIDPTTGAMRARIRYSSVSQRQLFGTFTDQFVWVVTPQ